MILTDSKEAVKAAAEALLKGGLVALPTDTVYGLAVLASDRAAVARLLRLKERPTSKPLVIQVASLIAARRIAKFSPLAEKLAAAFWPG
ncbi:MAG: Sua5/YciO/YrdC/YwlC family protein, partial [Sphingomonadales bacterium]